MPMHYRHYHTAAAGFSLIELMVTVAIVAILATIAISGYSSSVQKSRRTDARSAILDLAAREEKLFSTNNAYSSVPSDVGYSGAGWPIQVGNFYNLSVTTTSTTYTITATPIGAQLKDTVCTSLFVDQTGLQSATPTANAATCWGR